MKSTTLKSSLSWLCAIFLAISLYKYWSTPTTASTIVSTKASTTQPSQESMVDKLDYINIAPKSGVHKYTFVIVHGFGDSGNGWRSFSNLLQRDPAFADVRFILPNAPVISITAFGNQAAPSWFNIYKMGDPTAKQDVEGFLGSVQKLRFLIDSEIKAGIPAENIVLGGFSQGAALTIGSAATFDVKLGGFVSLSGFCSIQEAIKPLISKANNGTPMFQGHGTADPVIKYENGKKSNEFLKTSVGMKKIDFHTYNGMAHSTSPEEVADIIQFLKQIFV